jgi:hypothetical protein
MTDLCRGRAGVYPLALGRKTRLLPRAAQHPRRPHLSPRLLLQQQFLVDTGVAVSVFPHKSSVSPSGPLLSGAESQFPRGRVSKKLNFGLHSFVVSFILAAVSKPILGIDFFSAHRLLVESTTWIRLPGLWFLLLLWNQWVRLCQLSQPSLPHQFLT